VYKSLQSCRAIASLLVLLYHLGATFSLEKYFGTLIFYKPFSYGDCGVEFFFVLSGFIIHHAHHRDFFNSRALIPYVKKRIIRIYPVYWILFSFIYLCALLLPKLGNVENLNLQELLQCFLLIPCHIPGINGTGAPVLVVAWSLHYEILFYSIVGFFIAGRIGAVFIITILIICMVCRYDGIKLDYPFSYFTRDYMLLFLMGIMMSYLNQLHVLKTYTAVAIASIGFLFFISTALDTVFWLGLYNNLQTLMFGFSCSLIIYGLSNSERSGCVIGGNVLLQVLGNASYSLYLIHFPLLSVLCKLCVIWGMNDKGIFVTCIAYIIVLFLTIFISVKFHTLVEMPLTKWLRKRFL
jgi:exopolysaccharide production protein ExoZ